MRIAVAVVTVNIKIMKSLYLRNKFYKRQEKHSARSYIIGRKANSRINKQLDSDQRKKLAKLQPITSLKQHEFLRRLKENAPLLTNSKFLNQTQIVETLSVKTQTVKPKKVISLSISPWEQNTPTRSLLAPAWSCRQERFLIEPTSQSNDSLRMNDGR